MRAFSRLTLVVLLSAGAPVSAQHLYTLASPNEEEGAQFGESVSGVGDVDGDGRADVVVGAFFEDPGSSPASAGRAYVFSGATGALVHTLVSPNEEASGRFGGSVAGVGDVDGDDISDIVVGADGEDPGSSPASAGRAYVFSGATGALVRTLVSPNEELSGLFGASVSGIRDVDGDGTPDIIVGAYAESPGSSPSGAGRVYVFSGATGALVHTLASPTEETNGYFGWDVSGVEDVNGDATPDVVVGAYREAGGSGLTLPGRAYVYSGDTGALLHTLVSPNEQQYGAFGRSVSGIGDLNGDGRGDLLVGADGEEPASLINSGRAYVFSGANAALLYTLVAPTETSFAQLGFSVSPAGDADGDGTPDVAVGAIQEASAAGRVRVFSGATGALLHTLDAPDNGGQMGYSLAAAGDLTGDGSGGVIAGANIALRLMNPQNAGRAYVFAWRSPYLLEGAAGWRALALPKANLTLGGRGPGFLTNLHTAGYVGADSDQRNRRGTANVFLYDEPTGAYPTPRREDSVVPGEGFWVYVREDDDPYGEPGVQGGFPKLLDVSGGTSVRGDHAFSLSYTPASPFPGINLVGNPYDEAIDWDHPNWTRTDVSQTAYVYDPAYNGGDFRTWNGAVGDLAGGVIPAGQGFHVEAASASATLVVPEEARLGVPEFVYGKTGATGEHNPEGGHDLESVGLLSLSLSGLVGGTPRTSTLLVSLDERAALGIDPTDGRGLVGVPGRDALRLVALVPEGYEGAGDALSVASVPPNGEILHGEVGGVEIPLHAEALASGAPGDAEVVLRWDAASLPGGWTAVLRDRQTGAEYDLRRSGEASITLSASDALTHTVADLGPAAKRGSERDPLEAPPVPLAVPLSGAAADARFSLALVPSGAPEERTLAVGAIGPNPTRGASTVTVVAPESGEVTIGVFDALGRLVARNRQSIRAGSHPLAVPVGGLTPGVYVVRVEAPGGRATRRVTVLR